MPFFSNGDTKNKLSILFFLQYANVDLTKEQIHRAMVENDCMTYYEFVNAMYELEEDGYLAAIPRAFGQAYRVSCEGNRNLSLFENTLPLSLKERLKTYADSVKKELVEETQLMSDMEEAPDGSYMVHLRAVEKNKIILEINLQFASRNLAIRARENWQSASPDIYDYLLKSLIQK